VGRALIIDAFELLRKHPLVMKRWLSDEAFVKALIDVYHVDTSLDTGRFNSVMGKEYPSVDSRIGPVGIFRVRRNFGGFGKMSAPFHRICSVRRLGRVQKVNRRSYQKVTVT
jgi:hypothetical protein